MNKLKIELFGHARITPAGATVPAKIQKTCEFLFAYLLLHSHHPCSRDQLIGTFWGDQSESSARNCLNTALWRLRRVLEPRPSDHGTFLLTLTTDTVGFNWESSYWLDVECFTSAIEPFLHIPVALLQRDEVDAVEKVLDLYQGDLLIDVYQDWVLPKRESLHRLYLNSLAHLVDYYTHNKVFDKGLTFAQYILDLDPLREEMHRIIMQIYIESGQRPLAIRQYEKCRYLLEEELGVPPMPETEAIYRQITSTDIYNQATHCTTTGPTYQEALDKLQLALQSVDIAHSQIVDALDLMKACSGQTKPEDTARHAGY
jgi:DNA-binding SARP family transcriptional activator